MAFFADVLTGNAEHSTVVSCYCSINTFQNFNKDTLIVNIAAWESKAARESGRQHVELFRYFIPIDTIDYTSGLLAGIYTWLMQQPEFSNPVADDA